MDLILLTNQLIALSHSILEIKFYAN